MAQPREGTKRNISLRSFQGLNTQSARQVIGDDEFSWLENVMPVGDGNMKSVPAPSAALATLTGETCYYMCSGNISSVEYMFMFCNSGAAYQVNLTSYAKTTVGAAGTFSGAGTRIAQWKNERILIIDPANGYFDWNGTTLTSYKGTVFSATIAAGGINFTGSPTVTPSSGTSTYTATIGTTLATLGAAGTGYAVNDVLTVSGGTGSSPTQITVTTVSGGAITGFNISSVGDYSAAPANPVSVTGGHGSSATFTLNMSITKVVVVNPGSGYVTAPTLNVAGGGGSGASLTANLSNSTNGTTIEVYSGRVWIANGRTVVYSAAGSYTDFSSVSAGSFIATDSALKSSINRLIEANGYLYIIGGSSVNIISNVTVSSTTGLTSFSNTNICRGVGSEMGNSVLTFYRNLVFAVDYGFHSLTGVTPQKISAALDGIFPYIDFTQQIVGGVAIIHNILCLCYLVKYNDPATGTTRQILCIFFNGKWFISSQVANMTFVATGAPDQDLPGLYATDGANLYKLFSDTSATIQQTVRTKLWAANDPLITKQAMKFGLETISPSTPAVVTVDVETEYSQQTTIVTASNNLYWYNNSGAAISWTNNAAQPIVWRAAGYVFLRQDVSNVGNYLGITLNCSTPGLTYIGVHLQYEPRTPWAGSPW